LEAAGHSTHVASAWSNDGLVTAAADAGPFDFVVLPSHGPEIAGLELAVRCSAILGHPEVGVLLDDASGAEALAFRAAGLRVLLDRQTAAARIAEAAGYLLLRARRIEAEARLRRPGAWPDPPDPTEIAADIATRGMRLPVLETRVREAYLRTLIHACNDSKVQASTRAGVEYRTFTKMARRMGIG
jgi:hypothetical protein